MLKSSDKDVINCWFKWTILSPANKVSSEQGYEYFLKILQYFYRIYEVKYFMP